ncbi:thioredoxin family protein, partial [Bacteroidales bacterium OttesenSCG-928-I21]|nr:thioredoxin family protein [Bacteroidales bacterium OttesenSCG-928-I21]
MKKIVLILISFMIVSALSAQILNPVKWTFEKKDISDNISELIFKANIEGNWHLYGMDIPEDGPVATKIIFENLSGTELDGTVSVSKKAKESYDNNFQMTLSYYEKNVEFKQKVKIKNKNQFNVSGYVEYMVCNDETCLAPTREEFNFSLNAVSETVTSPEQNIAVVPVTVIPDIDVVEIKNNDETEDNYKTDYWEPVIDEMQQSSQKGFLWWLIFIEGFIHGLIAIFTPCVWPIIPMTVSFFLKRADDRRKGKRDAILYGVSIIAIYLFLGIIITLIFGANALNSLSTSAFFNLLFFALLVVFGASFLGAFEITLPASWTTKIDRKAEKSSGFLSIFLMAFTLALVSFSCTGPIIGNLLVNVSVKGSILAPAIGMFGFALALSVPFTFFALFPAWLQALPKSGGWLNSVKVTLGFLELALALKFLSIADLAYGWGILDREVFLVLWIVIFFLLGLYLLGKLHFAHDSEVKYISFHRITLSIICFAFSIYMVPGLWGAPLKAISAFAPPLYTQTFNLYKDAVNPEFHDFDEGMNHAKKSGKPVIVDFTGYGCVNCRKMEVAVWNKPQVKSVMDEEYVLISLFVDDKSSLDEPFEVEENGKKFKIKTVGDKWSYLQRYKFGANAQPFYVLLDNEGKPLNKSFSFTENADEFLEFLNIGLENYKKKN